MYPKFSIIVPTFNAAASLDQALVSVRSQQYPAVEVILIDGGSKDDTLAIAERYEDLVAQLRSEPDDGIYDAINKGVALATGDLVLVLGSDDQLADGILSAVAHAWTAQPSDIVAGQALMFAADGAAQLRADEDYNAGALVSGVPFCHNAMFATPDAYRRVGLYDTSYRMCADAKWVHRAIRAGCTCLRLDRVAVHFSLAGQSTVQGELTLTETYRSIVENFPFLSAEDAEHVFRTIRGWSGGERLEDILRLYMSESLFQNAVALAMLTRLRIVASASHATRQNIVLTPASLTQRIRRKLGRLNTYIRNQGT
ncbi:glycosyltransferase [Burkholderia stagnalis]|uniref:glycosyltransferase family 2 protein n=1 Tax=Burkholderia stagnalis TaxID=1503054 RepID=UPI000F59CD7A|nr:glycosyltransferase family 2 protein [Burkholderia stagnalis]RQQ15851.1 glycosyltransferase [Burkholderia stagnalis]RQQ18869.1 glycosyltransferase [Burkholderia stagnalis]RQQ39892.1 glycosyltransferase [Burkholderia stagnalis]RQQ99204.1 glycosyltransferase [Burkholderia stagnalis]RQX93267.1 glycosyltransferase [Burkholderia stagnalis]